MVEYYHIPPTNNAKISPSLEVAAKLAIYRPIFNSWQSGSGALHAAPFPPMGFVTAARSRDPIKWVGAPHHVTCHVTLVCTLPSLRSDTP